MPSGLHDGAIIVDTGMNNAPFLRDARQFKAAANSLKNTVNRVGQEMGRSGGAYLKSMQSSIRASREFERELQSLERQAKVLREALDKPGEGSKAYKAMEAAIKDVEAELAKAQKELDAFTGPNAKPLNLDEFAAAKKTVDDLTAKLAQMNAEKQKLATPTAADMAKYQEQVNAYNQVAAKIQQMRQAMAEARTPWVKDWREMVTLSGMVERGFERVRYAAGMMGQALAHPIQAVDRLAGALSRMIGNAALSFLKKLAAGAKNAAIQLAKLAGRAVTNGMKKLAAYAMGAARGLFGLGKGARDSGRGFQFSLKNLLKYGLGIRSLFVLFNRLRSAIKEGFGALKEYDPRVRASLASLSAALNSLKGASAAAFAPLLNAIAPALTTLINLVTQATNAVGMFFAALTGQSYYSVAKGVASIGKSAKSSSGSVKELKRQLAGFDELNILSAGSSGGSGSGGGDSSSGISFEQTPIAAGIKNFVEQIKALVAEENWNGLGAMIAEKINGALDKARALISWRNIGGKIAEVMQGITGTINGFVSGIDWPSVGATLAEGLNTIVNTALLWYRGIDWAALGRSLADALNGLIRRIEWANIGKLIQEKFQSLLDFTKNIVIQFDEKTFAKGLGEALGSVDWPAIVTDFFNTARLAFRKIGNFAESLAGDITAIINKTIRETDWNTIGGTFADGLNVLLDVALTWVRGIDWGELGRSLAEALNGLIRRINWANLGDLIQEKLSALLDLTRNFAITFDEIEAAKAIRTALGRIDWPTLARDFWNTAKTAFKKAGNFLKVLLGGDVYDVAGDAVDQMWERGSGKASSQTYATSWVKMFAQKVGQLLGSIPWPSILEQAKKSFLDAFDGLLDGLFNSENGDVVLKIATAVAGLKIAPKIITSLLGGGAGASAAGTGAGLGATGSILSALGITGIAGYLTGQKVWDDFKNNHQDVIEDVGNALVKFVEGRKLDANKTYEGTGNALADVSAWLLGGTDALDKIESAVGTWGQVAEAFVKNGGDASGWSKLFNGQQKYTYGRDASNDEIMSLAKLLLKDGYSFEEIQKALNLNTDQLKNLEELTRGNGMFGKLGDWMTGTDRSKTNTTDYLRAEFAANGGDLAGWQDAFEDNTKAVEKNTKGIEKQTKQTQTASAPSEVKIAWNPIGIKGATLGKDIDLRSAFMAQLSDGLSVDANVNFIPGGAKNYLNNLGGYLKAMFAPGTDTEARVALIKKAWQTVAGWVGLSAGGAVNQAVGLAKNAWTTISAWANGLKGNTAVNQAVGLIKNAWTTISAWANGLKGNTAVNQAVGLIKNAWTTISAWANGLKGNTAVNQAVGLVKNAWTTISAWANGLKGNTAVNQAVGLIKNAWTTISAWANGLKGNTAVNQAVGLAKNAWTTISAWANGLKGNTAVNQAVGLIKNAWTTISAWANGLKGNTAVNQAVGLIKNAWTTISAWANGLKGNTAVNQGVGLAKNWTGTVADWIVSTRSVIGYVAQAVGLSKSWNGTVADWIIATRSVIGNVAQAVGLEKGWGYGTVGGWVGQFISDFIYQGVGLSNDWGYRSVNDWVGYNFISGFVAQGVSLERNGWTDVTTWAAAFLGAGLTLLVGIAAASGSTKPTALGGVFENGVWKDIPQYARGTLNAGSLFAAGEAGPELVGHIGGRTEVLNKSQLASTMYSAVENGVLSALSRLHFRTPAMATGGVMPYEVSEQIARSASDIQDTLDANHEDLIQTIISLAGQIVAAVQRVESRGAATGAGGMSAQQIIDEINRRTQMFSASPLRGV